MATTITTSPLPALDSSQIQELRLNEKPDRYGAYNMILRAEQHAVEQRSNEDIISSRVAGYLLLEFHTQSHLFGDTPCASLVRSVNSPPQSASDKEHDAIVGVGKLFRDNFIRLCALNQFSFLI